MALAAKARTSRSRIWPILEAIPVGWTAIGDGWAVYGPTKDDAILEYREALGAKRPARLRARRETPPLRRRSRQSLAT